MPCYSVLPRFCFVIYLFFVCVSFEVTPDISSDLYLSSSHKLLPVFFSKHHLSFLSDPTNLKDQTDNTNLATAEALLLAMDTSPN